MRKQRRRITRTALLAVVAFAVAGTGLLGAVTSAQAMPLKPAASSGRIAPATSSTSYGCMANFAAGNACASLIADASGKYCLSSMGSRTGTVREAACNVNSDNQIWYVEPTGAVGEFEVWNYGDSCPANASYSGDKCGTPQGKAASGNPNYQNYGFCIGLKGNLAHANVQLQMSQCSNGNGTSLGNNNFLFPMTYEPIGYGPNKTSFLKYVNTHAGSPTLWVSTRGQSRPGATYVLQEPTKADEKDLEFYGATIGAGSNITASGPSNPPGDGNSPFQ